MFRNMVVPGLTGLLLTLSLMCCPSVIHANNWMDLSAADLKTKIDSGETIFLLNPLSDLEYNEGNIPGSINIPLHEIMGSDKLPTDKQTLVVTYCLGRKWVMYKEAAGLVANRRFSNIATFSGGLPAWKKAGFPLDTTMKLPQAEIPQLSKEEFRAAIGKDCVVDIRIPRMYGLGYFTKYLSAEMKAAPTSYFKKYFHKIPLSYFSKKFKRIPMDRRIVVIDHNGKRSDLAARFLKNNGYYDVAMLKGGMISFSK